MGKGQMVNLVTDKPSPITIALMQKQKAAALAQQQSKKDDKSAVFALNQLDKKGVPVLVNPVIMKNTEAETDLGLKMLVGPDEVSVAKKNAAKAKKVATFAEIESSDEEEMLLQLDESNPVNNPPWNNWSVYQPSVP